MAKSTRPKLKTILRQKKRQFLKQRKEAGGNKTSFLAFVDADYLEHPEEYDNRSAVSLAANAIWDENRKSADDDDTLQLVLNGVILPETFTYPDTVASTQEEPRFLKIAIEFATIFHMREDAILTMALGADLSAAGRAKLNLANEALRRAGGNPAKLVSAVSD